MTIPKVIEGEPIPSGLSYAQSQGSLYVYLLKASFVLKVRLAKQWPWVSFKLAKALKPQ